MKTRPLTLKQLSLNCREAMRLHSRSLDEPLPVMARLGLRIHLLLCRWCRRCTHQTSFLRSACCHLEHQTETTIRHPLPEEVRNQIQTQLKLEMGKM